MIEFIRRGEAATWYPTQWVFSLVEGELLWRREIISVCFLINLERIV